MVLGLETLRVCLRLLRGSRRKEGICKAWKITWGVGFWLQHSIDEVSPPAIFSVNINLEGISVLIAIQL
jgi:hypothetical protein